ncbi:conserved hypothetical protein [Xylanimonas cellulosilytica DSM 15894]|uniref:DUF4349 domain-containing protein n=1 Tax=Xylanimonas cellulosilytica (strain DSM 15894 / JCM 12276 / CECT 5975 / KCTC 9989 / LMG 20990 / NBRC 107835 / XIL07) TaxID=446471 RepID=D1BYZ9_XYLCX|nr:DUF4349 domain-containing protein [Xylanimonas cellulosilytica]ACZ30074.1 conserved hypothetical protein [Xylanimonas cellulosilytica DSM 15894]
MEALRPRTPARRRAGALAVVVTATLLAAGCSGSGSDAASDGAFETSEQRVPAGAVAGDELGAAAYDGAESPAGDVDRAAAEAAAREVITTGTATLVTEDPADAAARIATLTEQAGGRVERRQESRGSDTEPASARLTLRLPADRVNSTLEALRSLGDVADVSLTKEDVTATGRDLDARIAALETSTARLTELMAQAGDTEDLLRVEQELASRQGDLDALKAQRADLSDRVAMSTLEVWVTADEAAVAALAPPATGFRGGLEAGWDALAAFGRAAAVTVGAVLPWLAVAGVLALAWRAGAGLVRRARGTRPAVGTTPGDGA